MRRLLGCPLAAVLLLLLPPPTSAATPTPATEHAYILIQKDGNVVRLLKSPTQKGNSIVGSLWPNGELVLIRLDAVDEKRTADANRRDSPTPAIGQKVISQTTAVSGPRAPLGDRVKLLKPRAEAEKTIQSASGTGKKGSNDDAPERAEAGSKKPAKDGAEAVTGEAGEILDNNGKSEAWWRAKADRAKNELADAEGELHLAQQEQDRQERSVPPPGQSATASWAMELQRLRDIVDKSKARVDNAKKKLEELAESARLAGAYPGWVR